MIWQETKEGTRHLLQGWWGGETEFEERRALGAPISSMIDPTQCYRVGQSVSWYDTNQDREIKGFCVHEEDDGSGVLYEGETWEEALKFYREEHKEYAIKIARHDVTVCEKAYANSERHHEDPRGYHVSHDEAYRKLKEAKKALEKLDPCMWPVANGVCNRKAVGSYNAGAYGSPRVCEHHKKSAADSNEAARAAEVENGVMLAQIFKDERKAMRG